MLIILELYKKINYSKLSYEQSKKACKYNY